MTDDVRGTTWPLAARLWRERVRPYRRRLAIVLAFIVGVAA